MELESASAVTELDKLDDDKLEEELRKLEFEENKCDMELAALEREEKQIEHDVNDFHRKKDALVKEEDAFWNDFKLYEKKTSLQQDESS